MNSLVEEMQSPRPEGSLTRNRLPGRSFRATALWCAGLSATISLLPGCGGFYTASGVFPLPVIHLVTPVPTQLGLEFEDVRLTSANGQTLYGWFTPAEQARATVLIHHGAVVNRSSTYAHYVLFTN